MHSYFASKIYQLSFVAAFCSILALGACSPTPRPYQPSQDPAGAWRNSFANDIAVLDEDQKPLVGAQILIGAAQGSIPDNFIVTDASGHVGLPVAWVSAEPVTIDAPGHLRATYYAQEPGARTYQLRKSFGNGQYQVRGLTQGHNIVNKDGYVDFGLVIPALTRNDILSFNLDKVISTQMDTIKVAGQELEIPTNVTLPRQKETYIVPISLEKPTYQMYFSDSGKHRLFAARGRFPFKDVVKELRNETPFYDLINYFEISGGGVKDVDIIGSITAADISVTSLNFARRASVTAPSIGSDETMLVIGIAEMSGLLFPTDVKKLKSEENRQISTLDNRALVFSLLKKTADMESDSSGADRLSAVLLLADGAKPQFLPILPDIRLAGNGDVLISKINSIGGVNALATYSVLSEMREVSQGTAKVTQRRPQWEVYGPAWLDTVALPEWPEGNPASGRRRWEVNLLGSLNASQVELGPAMINEATHVTHTSLDF